MMKCASNKDLSVKEYKHINEPTLLRCVASYITGREFFLFTVYCVVPNILTIFLSNLDHLLSAMNHATETNSSSVLKIPVFAFFVVARRVLLLHILQN